MNAFKRRAADGEGGRKVLTKAEEQVMKVVWRLGSGLLMEIVEGMPAPAPHKNTVATILDFTGSSSMSS